MCFHRLNGDASREILVPALKRDLGTFEATLVATNVGLKHLGMSVLFNVQTEVLLSHLKLPALGAC
jgi:hypothetical protein